MKKVITDPAVLEAKKTRLKDFERYDWLSDNRNIKDFGRTKVLQAKRKKK